MPSEAQRIRARRAREKTVGQTQGEEQYEKIMKDVLEIAWEAAPMAMKAIAESAQDGDINASYYIINRTLGRPTEAPKQESDGGYSGLLKDLRGLRTGGASPGAGANDGGAPSSVETGGVPAESEAVGSPHEPSPPEADSGG